MPIIRPQRGPQENFLKSKADIAIYGGAAGGGKSWALLLEPLRHATTNPEFYSAFFRRTTVQIRNPGGLWDESVKLYGALGAKPREDVLDWRFPLGGRIKFAHLEHENTVLEWQGAQVPFIAFDELCHFTKSQFWYLLSRNRSMSGVKPYVRATCNPDADSWVAELISWWIDQVAGLPIPERSGVLRWFVRLGDTLIWADKPNDLAEYTMLNEVGETVAIPPKSLTFIGAKLSDNQALMRADPGYRANLMALPLVERERLLGGNWKIKPAAGLYFQRHWCEVIDVAPAGLTMVRAWDLAATPKTENNDPDWTCGTKIGRSSGGAFYILDNIWLRGSPQQVRDLIIKTASHDGPECAISIPQDPGQAGKAQGLDFLRALPKYRVVVTPESRVTGDMALTPSRVSAKVSRFSPFSAQAEGGNVYLVRGSWDIARYCAELEAFPDAKHDDSADSTSRAYATLLEQRGPMRISEAALARFGASR